MTAKQKYQIGLPVWLLWTILLFPHPLGSAWGKMLLVFAPLAIMPKAFDLIAQFDNQPNAFLRLSIQLQLPSALLFLAAFSVGKGWLALGLAAPWVLVTGLVALSGFLEIWNGGWKNASSLTMYFGMMYLAVGGVWALADRIGFQPLGFSSDIVFLTAAHFHYAGFLLPILTGFALRRSQLESRLSGKLIAFGVIAGVPLVAIGITLTRLGYAPEFEGFAASWMALSGVAVALLHLRLSLKKGTHPIASVLWSVAGIFLLGGMVLAGLYSTRFMFLLDWLEIPLMRALHGTANSIGFGFLAVLGWWTEYQSPKK